MIDSRIALGIRPPEFESPMNGLAKMLQLQGLQQANQLNTMTLQDKQRGLEEDNRLRDYFAKNDPNGPDFVRGLYGISPTQGGLYEKARLASQKDQAEIDAKRASTDKTRSEIVDARLKQSRAFLDSVQTPEQYMAWHEGNHQDPVLGPMLAARGITAESARAQIAQALQQPGGLQQLLQKSALGLEKFTELNKPSYQTQNTGDRTTLLAMPGLGGAPTTVSTAAINQSPDNRASNDRAQSEGDKNRAQQRRGQDLTDARARDKNNIDAGGGAKKPGPMSAALQKELLESDDAVQSSKSVVSTLRQALKLNDRAYSGYLAKERATAVSNLGGSERADATINIDNMMTGQGLEQMKSIFGAAPTEGERKILLEMQASADKTPAQRKSIMERAIAAAERRGQYAQAKAKAIRAGTYLTEGLPDVQDDAAPAGAATGPRFLGFEQ